MKVKKLAVLLVLVVLATGFIFYNSLKNSEESNKASGVVEEIVEPIVEEITGKEDVDVYYAVRKGAHLTEFFILGVTVLSVVAAVKTQRNNLIGYGLFYVLLVAVTDEYIQSFSDRTSSVTDVFIDLAGALIGFGVCALVMIGYAGVKERSKKRAEKRNEYGDKK
ncbi:MAG: VanZ family protein [Ruminococcaceae bacterium]|nr:VanZ family protein [Oscillospiraceae bacterium]